MRNGVAPALGAAYRLLRAGRAVALAGLASAILWALLTPQTLSAVHSFTGEQESPPAQSLPLGVAVGDVDQSSAVFWAGSTVTGSVIFTVGFVSAAGVAQPLSVFDVPRVPGKSTLRGLAPGRTYRYEAESPAGARVSGRFSTPAALGQTGAVHFGAGGDIRGDLAPFISASNVASKQLDFFVFLGDNIYSDVLTPILPGRAAVSLRDFRLKYTEVLTSALGINVLADLRASTALFATIDDHEVLNNFSGAAEAGPDERFPELRGLVNDTARYEAALRAFLDYHPLTESIYEDAADPLVDGEWRLYRRRDYGDSVALFLLDGRTFRDAPIAPASDAGDIPRFLAEAFAPGRTLLGEHQLADLQDDLIEAQFAGAVWKFIFVPEPIQNLGPARGEDRFEGYAAERSALIEFIVQNEISNVVFVAADVHAFIVNNVTYQTEAGGEQRSTGIFEVTTGPIASDPMGPTLVDAAVANGLISSAERSMYRDLPLASDRDSEPDDKDDFVKALMNAQLALLGYDANGLEGSPIDAELLVGDYLSLHTNGWTEFEVSAETHHLMVTTYGTPTYTAQEMASDSATLLAQEPMIVSQFVVTPSVASVPLTTTESTNLFLPLFAAP